MDREAVCWMIGLEELSRNQVLGGEQLWQEATSFLWQDPVPAACKNRIRTKLVQ
jgi:hypothetical protein